MAEITAITEFTGTYPVRRAWAVGLLGCLTLLATLSGSRGETGEPPEPLAIGATAPKWEGLPTATGGKHSFDELGDAKAVLVVFYANNCPDCSEYRPRIQALAKEYGKKGVATVLLNVDTFDEETLEKMTAHAKEHGFDFPYAKDPSQAIGKKYGAVWTPTAYVLDGNRKLAYRGALDDHWDAARVQKKYVRDALDAVLAGKAVATPTTDVEFGCHIEYED